jgi:hypothetical protein
MLVLQKQSSFLKNPFIFVQKNQNESTTNNYRTSLGQPRFVTRRQRQQLMLLEQLLNY